VPVNWQLLLKILLAILHALESLPADFNHQPLASAAAELLALATGHSPPEEE